MDLKVIRTDDQYQAYLQEVMHFMHDSPQIGSPAGDRLELLSVLIESYENTKYPVETPDPIDAIQFRMQEKGLKQADLVPYFGTRGRVSEVLARKRPLTVQMIRAVALGLGISADTLIGLSQPDTAPKKGEIDWVKFPISEMMSRGWLQKIHDKSRESMESAVQSFISEAGLQFGAASFRRNLSGDAESPTTRYALYAWLARVIQKARIQKPKLGDFCETTISASFLREIAQMSWSSQGPLMAIEYLEKNGIAVVIEPHLNGTLLDGAALKDRDGTPIISLTLRYDRLDNFWFTLLHEIAHLWKHVGQEDAFLDDLNSESEDRREAEANRLAAEAFIPRLIWKRSDAYTYPNKENIEKLSKELRIHPSIIVGRLRKETGNYSLFPDLLGQDEVRAMIKNSKAEV